MRVLTSRAYIGEREVNKLNRVKDPSLLKEEDRYYYTDAQWDAIIPQKLFFDVQELLIENKKTIIKIIINQINLLFFIISLIKSHIKIFQNS